MKDDIIEIRNNIKTGKYSNEASVSQGIVQRLLHVLGWPVYNTEIVAPEYPIEGRRVDFALCHPARKPVVLIEVKKWGKSNGADRQLFEYSFHHGVPMAVLTDGQEWHFFLPSEQGDYGERRVYKLDLLERDPAESENRLKRYLEYKDICSGNAIEAARQDYRDVAKKRQVKEALPEAWQKLINEEDELLIGLVSDKVESICGYKPDPDTVAFFLRDRVQLREHVPTSQTPSRITREPQDAIEPIETEEPVQIGFILHGKSHHVGSAKDVLIEVLKTLSYENHTFLERFVSLPKHGRTRRFVARNREELYPGRPDLAREFSHEFKPGWWVGTNVSKQQIRKIIKLACEVAPLNFGSQLRINLG